MNMRPNDIDYVISRLYRLKQCVYHIGDAAAEREANRLMSHIMDCVEQIASDINEPTPQQRGGHTSRTDNGTVAVNQHP